MLAQVRGYPFLVEEFLRLRRFAPTADAARSKSSGYAGEPVEVERPAENGCTNKSGDWSPSSQRKQRPNGLVSASSRHPCW